MGSELRYRLIGIWILCTTMPMLGLGQWNAGSGGSIYYNGGNVGIGTSAPGNTLAIVTDEPTGGPQLMITNTSPANYTQLGFEGTGQTFQVGVGNASEQVYGVANKYYIYDANAAAMRFVVDSLET